MFKQIFSALKSGDTIDQAFSQLVLDGNSMSPAEIEAFSRLVGSSMLQALAGLKSTDDAADPDADHQPATDAHAEN